MTPSNDQDGLKCVKGVWLPAHEEHLLHFASRDGWTYQEHKLKAAVRHCKQFRTAVDIGGHVGLWSKVLLRHFKTVHAFEPVALHRQAFIKNVGKEILSQAAFLYPCALGEQQGEISIHTTQGSSGDSWVEGAGSIPMYPLDDFHIADIDFIKIDCEGYELFILKGATQTIATWRPIIIVEQKPNKATKFGLRDTECVNYLKKFDYKCVAEMAGDFIMVPQG